jgi:hypothetical protein
MDETGFGFRRSVAQARTGGPTGRTHATKGEKRMWICGVPAPTRLGGVVWLVGSARWRPRAGARTIACCAARPGPARLWLAGRVSFPPRRFGKHRSHAKPFPPANSSFVRFTEPRFQHVPDEVGEISNLVSYYYRSKRVPPAVDSATQESEWIPTDSSLRWQRLRGTNKKGFTSWNVPGVGVGWDLSARWTKSNNMAVSVFACSSSLPESRHQLSIQSVPSSLLSLPVFFLPYLNETLWNTNPHSNLFLPCLNERLRAESKYPPHDMRTSPPHACRAVTSLSNKHFTTSRACPLAADVLVTPSLTHPPCGLVPVYYHVSLVDFPLPRTRRVPLTAGPGRIGEKALLSWS